MSVICSCQRNHHYHMAVLDTTTISDVNVRQLRQELTRRSLPTHGLKAALAERLQHGDVQG